MYCSNCCCETSLLINYITEEIRCSYCGLVLQSYIDAANRGTTILFNDDGIITYCLCCDRETSVVFDQSANEALCSICSLVHEDSLYLFELANHYLCQDNSSGVSPLNYKIPSWEGDVVGSPVLGSWGNSGVVESLFIAPWENNGAVDAFGSSPVVDTGVSRPKRTTRGQPPAYLKDYVRA